MSDNGIWMDIPTGRRLEQADYDPHRMGTLGPLRRVSAASLRLARRNLREIPEKDIEGQGLHLVERTSGVTWEVLTSHVDLFKPQSSGAEAFVVRDSLLVPLRPAGWKHEADESLYAGEVYGRQAVGRDPLPTQEIL
jgi:hypothetical protein